MNTDLAWIDYSEEEQREARELVRLLSDQNTVDELGLGVIRDGFSDILFPGTSVLHTRLRYFLFIPWIYLEIENQGTPSNKVEKKLKNTEVKLIDGLKNNRIKQEGIIGISAGEKLKVWPSSEYWNGLKSWGIRLFEGSRSDYHRSLDGYYRRQMNKETIEEEESLDLEKKTNWVSGIPKADADFLVNAGFDLSYKEACFIRDHVAHRHENTLLAFLFNKSKKNKTDVSFVWEHPLYSEFPKHNKIQVDFAKHFSVIANGIYLFYNYLLAAKKYSKKSQGLKNEYEQKIFEWGKDSESVIEKSWDWKGLWKTLEEGSIIVDPYTCEFIEEFEIILNKKGFRGFFKDGDAVNLVTKREIFKKRTQARLTNEESLKLWSGASSTSPMNFRWSPNVQRLCNDLAKGLTRGPD